MDCIQIILSLKYFFKQLVPNFNSFDIIRGIIFACNPVKIQCGWMHTHIIINQKSYTWGFDQYVTKQSESEIAKDPILLDTCKSIKYCKFDARPFNDDSFFFPFNLLHNAQQIRSGKIYIMIQTKLGKLYSSGSNNFGQLGLGHYNSCTEFQEIALNNIIRVDCGKYHVIALTDQNDLYGWGNNFFGQ